MANRLAIDTSIGGTFSAGPPLVERALALVPEIMEQSERNEAARRIMPGTLVPLRKAGLLHFWVPQCFGGGEVSLGEAMQIIEALAYADGSTGWAIMANQVSTASAAAFLKPEAAQHIFGNGLVLIAGQGAPLGRAEVVEGGYQLSGNWGYGSGILHSDWLHTGGLVVVDGRPRLMPNTDRPDGRIFVLPIDQVTLKDNWDVIGLRATGSVDYSVTNAHVGENFTHPVSASVPHQGGDIYRIGLTGLSQIGHTSFALGIAKRALEEILLLTRAEKRPLNLAEPDGGESFQEQYGIHLSRLIAARAAEADLCEEMERTTSAGNSLTARQVSQGVLVMHMVHNVAFDIVKFAYMFGGGTSLRAGCLQRLYRDMSAAMQHAVVAPGRLREATRQCMGLREGKVWYMGRLVDP